jgi:hypothetical protein
MAKKTILILLSVFGPLVSLAGQSSLVSAYKGGKVVLAPDPGFGRGVDWASLALNFANDMTVAPDGSIFVANNREHAILKFGADGRFIKKFGRKGQGPGDFEFPCNLDILDGRTLIVGEYAQNRKVSFIDLDGGLIKVLRTDAPSFNIAALRGQAFAFQAWSFGPEGAQTTGGIDRHRVFIKHAGTGREVPVMEAAIPYHGFRGGLRLDGAVCGTILIAGTRDGDLLVCDTRKAEVQVFDPSGARLRKIALELKPFPLTRDRLRRYKAKMIQDLRDGPATSVPGFPDMIRDIEGASWSSFVDGHFPLCTDMAVDAAGNLLVFKTTDVLGGPPIMVQAYSPEGRFLAEFELDPGPFKVEIDHRFRNLCFTEGGIIGMFPRRGDPDEIIVLLKAALPVKIGDTPLIPDGPSRRPGS